MSETVLIVDDSLTVRMDLADAFADAGFATVPCATVAEARRALAHQPVHACVLDVVLPDGDGVALLDEIRHTPIGASAVIVMLSSETEVADRVRGLQTGADEYVGKPYDAGYLVARVRELLHLRQAPEAGRVSILVIDDSVTFREALRAAFESAGHRVLTAPTGEEGLRIAGVERPDAIVVDGVLPGIDGPTVIRHLRLDAVLRDTPCLLLTGSEEDGAELRALDAGADAFVRKEEDLAVILAKLTAMLRRTTGRPAADEDRKSLLGPRKILAALDGSDYAGELSDALRTEGYDVVVARNAQEIIELLAVQAMDCILIDVALTGGGALEATRRIKATPIVRDIPLVLVAADRRDSMVNALEAGADDYLWRSSEFDVLAARIRAQIRRKQFEDENRRVREELLRKELEAAEARAARELAETRASLVEELERKNQELEAFSYSVSHDLRAPLRVIDGFGQQLAEACADVLTPEARGHLDRVRAATRRMGELIDDLLELSRVGRAELRRDRVNLHDIAQSVVGDLRKRDPERDVEVAIQPDLPASADGRLIRIVFENLVGNSWKFTARATHPTIECGSERKADGQIYFVRDNGAGFDMAYAEKLFRPFSRLHSASQFPGTGVGLATVSRIIDRHGGRIWAEGAVGRGATFYFTLPPEKASLRG